MKKLFLIGLCIFFSSCSDDDTYSDINGNYTGFFERGERTGEVSLSFNDGIYTGATEFAKFPAICEGNYVVNNNTISFSNVCIWTAEFDWSLILNGDWRFTLQDNELILTNKIGDRYVLDKN